ASWKAYTGALEAYAARAQRTGEPLAETYLELARVHGEALSQPERALAMLRDAAGQMPGDVRLAVAFARQLRATGAYGAAIGELERALHVDVRAPDVWRELAATLRASGDAAEAVLALVPLRALD